jgi:hypothetical protein
LLAQQAEWAALSDAARDEAFNAVNGEVTRWSELWPALARALDMPWTGPEEARLGSAAPGQRIAACLGGADPARLWPVLLRACGHESGAVPLSSVFPVRFVEAVLSRSFDVVTSMSKARAAGFAGYADTAQTYERLFRTLEASGVVPSGAALDAAVARARAGPTPLTPFLGGPPQRTVLRRSPSERRAVVRERRRAGGGGGVPWATADGEATADGRVGEATPDGRARAWSGHSMSKPIAVGTLRVAGHRHAEAEIRNDFARRRRDSPVILDDARPTPGPTPGSPSGRGRSSGGGASSIVFG